MLFFPKPMRSSLGFWAEGPLGGNNEWVVHPVNEYELLRDIPPHEENGDEVFSW